MGTKRIREVGSDPAGPTLYLGPSALDPTESFCTAVFDDAIHDEYRVVQLTSVQSFESIRDALHNQLAAIDDPSEAAVIITTPRPEDEPTVSRVGDETPLYGFRVNPEDLTGISVAFSQLIEKWGGTTGSVRICLRDIESLLPYHDDDLVYRFLNTVLATLQGAGADVHAHLDPTATGERTLQKLESLFSRVVESDESETEATSTTADSSGKVRSSSTTDPVAAKHESNAPSFGSDDVTTGAMSDTEIDDFLESAGYGILALDGDSPYAIPLTFGYDADRGELYLHVSTFDGSEKRARLADSNSVSMVVTRYERPDQWRSVIIDGSLVRLSPAEIRRRDVHTIFATGKLASVDVFNRDLSSISFDWYVLEPSAKSGRRSVVPL